ncbi:MAG: DUF2807 domain-containing protein [Cyclobacteriaceae bacterium]
MRLKIKGLVILMLAVTVTTLTGCFTGRENIDGPIETEIRSLDGDTFAGIEMRGIGDVQIFLADSNYIEINTHTDLFNNITTDIVSDILVIDLHGQFTSIDFIKFKVYTTQSLNNIELTGVGNIHYDGPVTVTELNVSLDGVGNIEINDVQAEDVIAKLFDVGNITLSGLANQVDYLNDGVGNIEALELESLDATANLEGVGNIEVNAVETLVVDHDGVGKIYYVGNPEITIRGKDRDVISIDD